MTETAAVRIKRVARARERLHVAGERWHLAAKHPGTYEQCSQQSCYQTNRMVAR